MIETNQVINPGIWTLILRTLRPWQWIKNSFILAPALFTLQIIDVSHWLPLAAGFLGFSFVASAVYAFNDICNRSEDKLHPVKRDRPVASGSLRIWQAALLSLVSLTIGIALLIWINRDVIYFASTYMILMIAYSAFLRNILIVDVIIIAIGFVLRVFIGAAIIAEPLSHWLVLCTFTIALFLGMIKRRQELVSIYPLVLPDALGSMTKEFDRKEQLPSRNVLTRYPSIRIIDGWINVLTGMTILCYALYTVDPQTIEKHHTDALIYTLPLVLFGIFRYQHAAFRGDEGEDPAGLVLRDNWIRFTILLWAVIVGVILYLARYGT